MKSPFKFLDSFTKPTSTKVTAGRPACPAGREDKKAPEERNICRNIIIIRK